MAALLFLLAAIVLLGAFLALTAAEEHRGVRFFDDLRASLDRRVMRATFVFAHVDLGALIREEVRRSGIWLGHSVVHGSLQAVRVAERALSRAVRRLRAHRALRNPSRASSRAFVQQLSDFKERLKESHPAIPDIHSVE